jgi:transposase
VRTVEPGVTITDAAVDGDVTVVFCNLLDDGVGRRCPGSGGEGVYRDTVIRKVTDVQAVGHPLRLRVRVPRYRCPAADVRGKCSPTTPPSSHARAHRPPAGAPATSCTD